MARFPMTADQASIFCERFRVSTPAATPVWDQDGLVIQDQYAAAAQALWNTGLPLTKDELVAYANEVQWAKAIGGYTATVDGDEIEFSTAPESLSLISGKVQRLQQPNPPGAVKWQTGPSTFVDISRDNFIAVGAEVADFVQSTFDMLDIVIDEITATPPTITTKVQIDAAFAE